MTIYIDNRDNENEVITLEVPDKFEVLITEIDDQGDEGSRYEKMATKFVNYIHRKGFNPYEAYRTYEDASSAFDPFFCF